MIMKANILFFYIILSSFLTVNAQEDPYLWLEEVEAKSDVAFLDENTVLVSTDFGEQTMTSSGYPRQVKLWKRGTLLKNAKLIYEGEDTDVACSGYVMRDGTVNYAMIINYHTTFTADTFVWMDDKAIELDVPDDCNIQGILNNQLILDLKSDWEIQEKTYPQGSLISLNFTDVLKGKKEIQLILRPDEFSSISQVSQTENKLIVNVLRNVNSELHIYSFDNEKWEDQRVPTPGFGTISIINSDEFSDCYFFQFENLLNPSTLYVADATENSLKPYKSLTAYFDRSKYEVGQFKSKSRDGTLVPYFVVSAKNMKNDGKNPTLLYGYGGFEISVAFTQKPELFNAVACLAPLLDMQRYSKLLAGASWIPSKFLFL